MKKLSAVLMFFLLGSGLSFGATYFAGGSMRWEQLCSQGIYMVQLQRNVNNTGWSPINNLTSGGAKILPSDSPIGFGASGGDDAALVSWRLQYAVWNTSVTQTVHIATYQFIPNLNPPGGAVDIGSVYPTCSGTIETNWCIKVSIKNSDVVEHAYFFRHKTTLLPACFTAAPSGNWMILQPGQSGTIKMCGVTDPTQIEVAQLGKYGVEWFFGGIGDCVIPVTGTGAMTSGTLPSPAPTILKNASGEPSDGAVNSVGAGGSNTGSGTAPDMSGTNSPITWAANGTNVAMNDTMKQGFSSLYDSSERQTKVVTDQSQKLADKLDLIRSAITNIGLSSGSSTNASGFETGVVAAITGFHMNNTNWLANINHSITNRGTNMATVQVYGTNAVAALDQANIHAETTISALDDALSEMGSGPDLGYGSGSPSMTVDFLGNSLDISPDAIIPGVTSFLKALISFVVLIGFGKGASKLIFQASQTYATAQTGGVPNLGSDVPIVGNSIGAVVAAIIPFVFIVIWMSVFALIIPLFTGVFFQIMSGIGGLTPGNVIATSLIAAVLPVNLMVNCAWTYIVLHLTAAKVVVIAGSASRFLLGK